MTRWQDDLICPCCLGKLFSYCCEPFILSLRLPDTAYLNPNNGAQSAVWMSEVTSWDKL